MKNKKWEEEFDKKFPLFGCDDEYCCPCIETEQWESDIATGDKDMRIVIKQFIRSLLEIKDKI